MFDAAQAIIHPERHVWLVRANGKPQQQRSIRIKIAIPSETDAGLESIRSGHFGHAAYMTVVEFDDDMNIVGVESVKNADHDAVGCGGVIDFVSGIGVDGILTVGMGMPPFTRFTNAGIKVYSDTTEPSVGNVARLFAEGKVALMDPANACRH